MNKRILAMTMLIAVVACNDDSLPADESASVDVKVVQVLEILDAFGQPATVFMQGETITFSLSAKNITNEEATLGFGTGRQVDFYVRDPDDSNTTLWDPDPDKVHTQATTSIVLMPFETKSYQRSWDQMQLNGEMLPAGSYLVEATFFQVFSDFVSVEFEVR